MKQWASDHPWMTFFLAVVAIDGIVYMVRGPKPGFAPAPAPKLSGTDPFASSGQQSTSGKMLPWLTPAPYLHRG